jgi:membrane-bound lytic murein transglycosylase B
MQLLRNALFFSVCFCFLCLPENVLPAAGSQGDPAFQKWLDSFYSVAARRGITRKTFDLAFAGVTSPDRSVLRKAAYQPEFTTEIWDYLDNRITDHAVRTGQLMGAMYKKTLDEIEHRFGVEREVVLAIWSMETNYGAILLRTARLHHIPRALATLAYGDKKRRKFAEKQLIAVLKIIQDGHITPKMLIGSWAGAMGHTQFIPTSYLAYGVDMDKDGKKDIWNSIPDALATAANLLHKNGWRTGKRWGYEVIVPAGGEKYKDQTRTLSRWRQLGFFRPGKAPFPESDDRAELKLLGGERGPGFLALRNFFVIKRYNNSNFYALAVGLLSDRLAGRQGMVGKWPRPAGSLSREEKLELQKLLRHNGLYDGEIDGYLGPKSRQAIRIFQRQHGLAVDGRPSLKVLQSLREQQ